MEINVELVFKINEAELIRGDATLGSEREVTSDGGVRRGRGEREIRTNWQFSGQLATPGRKRAATGGSALTLSACWL